jgi:hypothetical protein
MACILFFALSILSQFLFFSVCSFLFFAVFLSTGSGILCYLITCLYGAIDYVSLRSKVILQKVNLAFGETTPRQRVCCKMAFYEIIAQTKRFFGAKSPSE